MTIAAASVDVRTRLRAFYPMLSEQSFEEKIAQAKDPFTFFRSFVPYFYVLLAEEPGLTAEIPDSVRACEGWCVGDPHPENFGSALLANDARVFAVSDVDDGGPGFFYADFLRFLCGARLGKPEVDVSFERVLAAYLFGLQTT